MSHPLISKDSNFIAKLLLSYYPEKASASIFLNGLILPAIYGFALGLFWFNFVYSPAAPSPISTGSFYMAGLLYVAWLLLSSFATLKKSASLARGILASIAQLFLTAVVSLLNLLLFLFAGAMNPNEDDFVMESKQSDFGAELDVLDRYYSIGLSNEQTLGHHFTLALWPDPIRIYLIDGVHKRLNISDESTVRFTDVALQEATALTTICRPEYFKSDKGSLRSELCDSELFKVEVSNDLEPMRSESGSAARREHLRIYSINDGEYYLLERIDH